MNKFNAKKIKFDNLTFDSHKEYQRFLELRALESRGKIKNLQVHVPYTLFPKSQYGREIKYIADYVYELDGETIVEDVKSKATITRVYKLKKRILQELKGITIKEFI